MLMDRQKLPNSQGRMETRESADVCPCTIEIFRDAYQYIRHAEESNELMSKCVQRFCMACVDYTGYFVYVCFPAGQCLEFQHSVPGI